MAENDPGPGPTPPEDARLISLEQRLKQAQHDEAVRTGQTHAAADKNEQLGNRALSYLIGGLGGGAVIGWALDQLLGTSPWLLLILLFLGTAAGFWNIIKLSSKRPK